MSNPDALSTFETSVAAQGYEWVTTLDGPLLTPRPHANGEPEKRYRPFSRMHSGLFREFSQLKLTQDAILAFANRYGLLGEPVTQSFENSRLAMHFWHPTIQRGELFDEAMLSEESAQELERYGRSAHSWTSHIRAMAGILRAAEKRAAGASLWNREGNTLSLGMSRNTWRVVPTNPERPTPEPQPPTPGMRAMEGPFIANRMSAMLRQVVATRLDWIPDPAPGPGRFRLEFAPGSLVGCLWLQAAMALSQQKDYRACIGPGCDRLIEVSLDPTMGARTDTQFCSDACKSRDYRHRKTRARALGRKGETPAKIAKTLRSDTATVRRWLTNR